MERWRIYSCNTVKHCVGCIINACFHYWILLYNFPLNKFINNIVFILLFTLVYS